MIHKDGKRWENDGRKIAYLKKSAAKGVITNECNKYAFDRIWNREDYFSEAYQIAKGTAFDEELKRFKIVEYVPKGE
ncbi:hypothetical protein [Brevibacillus laterosporus]|uniref:hypothetical protein n=1 Tax=Brevibacillus laterosporus TaxID=1465 RepID=UPI002E1B3D08|nr:hypothetical protein [Brevibacillus laterosporus]MED1667295.1 hypothetical protein [Brevibacillus laterosporus]MED1718244.1 hypothetical protein [Brevibacillus laterosporus]